MSRRELEEERAFLFQSLRDLNDERTAGDLTEEDFAALRDRYTARAATVLRTLGTAPPPTPAPPPGRHRRRSLLVVGALLILGGITLLVVLEATSSRLPGQTGSGSARASTQATLRQELGEAEALDSAGDSVDALRLYGKVLVLDPTQPEALAESGWLEFGTGVRAGQAALIEQGQRTEEAAVRAAPGSWSPRLYLGQMYLAENDPADAVAQFTVMLADRPPPPAVDLQPVMGVVAGAFTAVHQPLPALPPGVTVPVTTVPATTSTLPPVPAG